MPSSLRGSGSLRQRSVPSSLDSGSTADFDGSVLTRDEAVQTAYETDPLRVPASTARLGRETLRTMKHVQMTLDRLRIPTYVLHGSDDTLVPPAASESLASLPNVTRQIWDGLRHECMNEPEHARGHRRNHHVDQRAARCLTFPVQPIPPPSSPTTPTERPHRQ